MVNEQLRLFVAYWLNAITCFSVEDLYLGLCVVMDIIKQNEIKAINKKLCLFEGMKSACSRFGLPELPRDFTKMRNDLVYEGKLSGTKFNNKTKEDCIKVVVMLLNWLDLYFVKIVNLEGYIKAENRFSSYDISSLPSFSLFNK